MLQYLKDKQIAEIDKDQESLVTEQTKTRSGLSPSPIYSMIERMYEKEIALLWKATEERKLRVQAVEALQRHEEQLFGKVQDIILPTEEPRTGRWSRPSVKMMKVDNDQRMTDEEEEIVIQRIERAGEANDQEHQRFIQYARTEGLSKAQTNKDCHNALKLKQSSITIFS